MDISVLPYPYVQRLIHDPAAREKDFVHLITPVFATGVRTLFDPQQLMAQLATVFSAPVPFEPPSSAVFVDFVENFWQRAVRISKTLRAGRLYAAHRWSAAQADDLIRLAEWHARLTRNLPPSTWYRDKYMEQWGDPRVIMALPQVYPHYDAADTQRALFATMDVSAPLRMKRHSSLVTHIPTLATRRLRHGCESTSRRRWSVLTTLHRDQHRRGT